MKRFFLLVCLLLLALPYLSYAENWKDIEFYGEGQTHKLSDYKGKTVLLMFWATWCPYCKQQIPSLSLLKKLYTANPNFEVITVSIDEEGEDKVKNYLKSKNITNLPSYIDIDSNLMHSLGFSAIPSLVLISDEGNLLGSYRGLQDLDVQYIEEVISKNAEQKNK